MTECVHADVITELRADVKAMREKLFNGYGERIARIEKLIESLEEELSTAGRYVIDHHAELTFVKGQLELLIKRPRSFWLLFKDLGLFLFAAATLAKLAEWW